MILLYISTFLPSGGAAPLNQHKISLTLQALPAGLDSSSCTLQVQLVASGWPGTPLLGIFVDHKTSLIQRNQLLSFLEHMYILDVFLCKHDSIYNI